VSVTTVRILHAVGTLLIAVAILNFAWYRVVYRPIQRLLAQINIMGRGTWKSSLPVNRNDEIGELTTAFNRLGQQLTSSFEYINTSSRLSALALIGTRLVREVNALRGQIAAARRSFETRTDAGDAAGITMLTAVQDRLESLETRFQRDFEHELSSMSVAPPAPDALSAGKALTAGSDAGD
jgi:HAMP domain-containing protein